MSRNNVESEFPMPLWEQNGSAPKTPKRVELIPWAAKVMTLLDNRPHNQIHNKLSPAEIEVFENGVMAFEATLKPLLVEPEKEKCQCGCGLSAAMTQVLARAGVPCMGLTPRQAGLIISKLEGNEWKLPEAWAFCKNSGEWIERKFKGKKQHDSNSNPHVYLH